MYIARRATAAVWADAGVFLKHATNATTNTRWGDYEASSFASWTTNAVWFGTEYSRVGGDWATHIDKVNYANLAQQ